MSLALRPAETSEQWGLAPAPATISSLWLGAALAVVLAFGILLRSTHMTDVNSRSPDEQTYTAYAARLADEGFGVYRELFATYDSSPSNWIYPSPTRFGHVVLFAGMMKLTGVRDGRAGAAVSWSFSILSMLLAAWIGIRFFNPWVALLAPAFLAFSFSELAMARRAWQDTTFGFCGLLLVYLTCEIARAPGRRLPYIAFFALASFCLLTKETAILSFGYCGLWLAAVMLFQERSWKLLGALALGALASFAIAFTAWMALAGDIRVALASVDHSTRSGAGAWAKLYCSGPWYQFLYLLWIVGPLTAAAAAIGAAVAVLSWNRRISQLLKIRDARAAGMTALMTLGFVSFAAFVPNLQYLRIISPADGTYCLLAALGFWFLLSFLQRSFAAWRHTALVLLFLVLTAAAVRDYREYTSVVVRSGMEELSVYGIRSLMGR